MKATKKCCLTCFFCLVILGVICGACFGIASFTMTANERLRAEFPEDTNLIQTSNSQEPSIVVLTKDQIKVNGKTVRTKENALSGVVYFQKEREENGEKAAKCLKLKIDDKTKWAMLNLETLGYKSYFDKD